MTEGKAVTVSYARLALLAIGLLLVGACAAEAPSLYQDLRFLHLARLVNEQQAQQAQQAQAQADAAATAAKAQQGGTRVEHIDQSQVHPGVVPPESPPKGK